MKKRLPCLPIVLLATFVLATAMSTFAQNPTDAARPGKVEAEPPVFGTSVAPLVTATRHVIQGAYLSDGNGDGKAIASATFTPVDTALTVPCPGTSGTCTISAHQTVETNGSTSGNNAALCFAIDGSFVANSCFFTNQIPADGAFDQSVTISWGSGVKVGNHTVQTVLYCSNGCNLFGYNIQYTVYKP